MQRRKCSAINRYNRQLFDHLGGAQQNRWGYRKAERLGDLEVDGHLKFCRELHREIARLCAAQDAIRDRPRLSLAGSGRRRPGCQDDVGLEADRLLRERSYRTLPGLAPAPPARARLARVANVRLPLPFR